MKFKFTCFVLLFLARQAFVAQSPGYMGKTLTVGYGANFSPVTFGTNAQNKSLFRSNGSAESGKLVFNYTHEGYLEYAMSTRWIVGASVRYYRTTYDNRENVKYLPAGLSSSYTFEGLPSGYYTIKGLTFLPYFKVFKKQAVAPWGRYFMFGPAFNKVNTSYDAFMNIPGTIYGHDTLISSFGPNKSSQLMFDVLLGFGRTRVIAKKFTIDYGFNTQPLGLFSGLKNFWLIISDQVATTDEYIAKTSKTRVHGITRFNFYVRFGLLW